MSLPPRCSPLPSPSPAFRLAAAWGVGLALAASSAFAGLINEWEPIDTGEVHDAVAQEIQTGKPWTEPVSGMEMVWIAPGCFKMGSPPRVEGRDADEGPVHEVCLSGYWIGRTEVTQGAWRKVMRSNPAIFRKGDEYPMEHVSWEDAEAFIRKLNTLHPGEFFFRLPTESEWEFACNDRGQSERYAGGNDPHQAGWYRDNSSEATQPTAIRKPNHLKLFDMSGNVWEWMADAYDGAAYAKHEKKDPITLNTGLFRVIRGGGWKSAGEQLRCANRGFENYGSRRDDIGLRLVLAPKVEERRRYDLKELSPF